MFSHEDFEEYDEVNTQPHFCKARDFLTMVSPRWEDVNIFVANLFSCFSGYGVRWKSDVRYPTEVSSYRTDVCVVDFAVAVQTIPPTTTSTILRAPSLPLTISSPAVILGIRSTCFEDNGLRITNTELATLQDIMKPHLQLFQVVRDMALITVNGIEVDLNPSLFCTYLKKGYIHLLSFRFDRRQSVRATVLDSFPVSLDYSSHEDLYDRMRIAMAMLTLQRKIAKICDDWGWICWSPDTLSREHDTIVEVTGINSPTPTESTELNDSDWDELDSDSENDEALLQQAKIASIERVSAWLALLRATHPPENVPAC
ncbi:hypothetical protein NM688_g2110 [Phlebia brevispora]|uniref:Uncharacterized protein n=1 Tax=Phlebia brevispora TaxID=194682 RepID=A0ACC1T9F2_9APHY|nr:hypothetical protein NM688_g2110 [Phlebia brevispora]